MGVYGFLKNYSCKHDFNLDWKNSSPSVDYIKEIARILGWNLTSDLIIFEYDDGWKMFVNNDWKLHDFDVSIPHSEEEIIDTLFLEKRDESGWLTLDRFTMEIMMDKKTYTEDPIKNISLLIEH
jgi:hypothetical protein